jgi:hypothetical protein
MIFFHTKKEQVFIPKEYQHIQWLRIISLAISVVLTGLLGVTIFFVYNNVYNTVDNVETILTLQSDLKIEPIDFTKLDRVNQAWIEKHSTSTIILTNDPFVTKTDASSSTPVSGITIER